MFRVSFRCCSICLMYDSIGVELRCLCAMYLSIYMYSGVLYCTEYDATFKIIIHYCILAEAANPQ